MQNMLLSVSGQLTPEEKFPPVRIGVWVKVRVRFRVGGQPDNCPRDNSARLGLGLGFVLGLGATVQDMLFSYHSSCQADHSHIYECI